MDPIRSLIILTITAPETMLLILILIDDNNGNLLCKDSRRQTFCKVLSNVLVSELEAIPGFPMLSASQ